MAYQALNIHRAQNPDRLVDSLRYFIQALFLITLLVPVQSSYAIVTSDTPVNNGRFSHVVPPFGTAFGIDLDGVSQLYLYVNGNPFTNPGPSIGSGVRLKNSDYILTAAHVAVNALGNATAFVDGIQANFRQDGTPFHGPDLVTARASNFGSNIILHPDVSANLAIPSVDAFEGYDIALIRFSSIDPDIPGYSLFTGDPIGHGGVVAGYGAFGHGDTGQSGTDGQKRAGLNTYEANPGITVAGIFSNNLDTQIAMDFEKPGDPATSFHDLTDTGFGNHEVLFAQGDSGGPTFINAGSPKIAGIHSYITGDLSTDVTNADDASWGDVGVDAWVGHADIRNWIIDVVYNQSGWSNFANAIVPTTPNLADVTNWYGGTLPSPSRGASIEIGGTFSVLGPQSGVDITFRDLTIGGDDGLKTLTFSEGGSFSVVDNISIPKNAVIIHEVGAVSATELIVGSELGSSPAQYLWAPLKIEISSRKSRLRLRGA